MHEAVQGADGMPDDLPQIQLLPQHPLLSTAFPQLRAAAQLLGLCDWVYISVWHEPLLGAWK